MSALQGLRVPLASCGSVVCPWCTGARHSSVMSPVVGPLFLCDIMGLLYSPTASFPKMSGPVLLLWLSLWTFAANHEAGSKVHTGSSHPTQLSKVEASPVPDSGRAPWGTGVSLALRLRGMGARDLELPAPSMFLWPIFSIPIKSSLTQAGSLFQGPLGSQEGIAPGHGWPEGERCPQERY